MANLRLIALNGSAGAFVNIYPTVPVRKFDGMEDEGGNTQGIAVLTLLDNFVTTNTFSFGSQPISIPDPQRYPALGPILGLPAQGSVGAFNYTAAKLLMEARSATVTGTTLRFEEWE